MSSPVPVAPRRRALAGPVVLIILGIVFLMGTMGVLHWAGLWRLYAQYWPVLIIVWGVIKLIEYQQAHREGTRGSGIGAGGVFLLICLIVTGLMATQASRVNWGELGDAINIDDGDFQLFGNTYTYTDQLEQAFPAGGNLRVTNEHGAVNVNVSDGDQIKVVVRKRVRAESQQDADKCNAGTRPQITVSGKSVTLDANTHGVGERSVAADLDIFVPRKATLNISSRRGDVNVNGRDADVDISNQHGDILVEDVTGNVKLNLDKSSGKTARVSGDVTMEGRGTRVSVSDVKGAAHLSGEFFDSIHLSRIGKSVTFKSSRTDLEFSKLEGDLDLDSGDLRANSLTGPLRLLTKSKDIHLEEVSGDVRVEDTNGVVELRAQSLGNIQIDNRKGDIQVIVPGQAGFRVEAKARGGEIESDFPELKIESGHDEASATGTVGSGAARLLLNNEHGTIEIRKGSATAGAPPAPPAPPAPKAPRALPAPKAKPAEPTEN